MTLIQALRRGKPTGNGIRRRDEEPPLAVKAALPAQVHRKHRALRVAHILEGAVGRDRKGTLAVVELGEDAVSDVELADLCKVGVSMY